MGRGCVKSLMVDHEARGTFLGLRLIAEDPDFSDHSLTTTHLDIEGSDTTSPEIHEHQPSQPND
jgi:hypothetical protein